MHAFLDQNQTFGKQRAFDCSLLIFGAKKKFNCCLDQSEDIFTVCVTSIHNVSLASHCVFDSHSFQQNLRAISNFANLFISSTYWLVFLHRYRCILPTLLKAYSNHQDNFLVVNAIEVSSFPETVQRK